jgi:hypothetical protein
MRLIVNLILIIGAVVFILVAMGFISTDELLDMFGEVQMGDTEQIYDEGEFQKRFDLIVGSVEVNDTSTTPFDRKIALCKAANVKQITNVHIEYRVNTTPQTFYLDVKKKEFYISPDLGVTYSETNRNRTTVVEESNCVKKRDITVDDLETTKRRADAALKKAIENSEKIVAAKAEFEMVKSKLVAEFNEAGFIEVLPPTPNVEKQPMAD